MILDYGGYRHAQDECSIIMDRQTVYAQNGVSIEHELQRWTIEGEVQGTDGAAVVAAFNALYAAYSTPGRDITLYFNDGSTIAHQILNSQTYSGVKIVNPPSNPIGDGTELHNARSYRIVIEAEVKPTIASSNILYFEESVTIEGGGPELAVVPLLRGPVDIQTLYQQTEVMAVQEGTVVGRDFYPSPVGPLWPGFEWRRRRRIRRVSPKLRAFSPLRYTDWRVEYSYTFISAGILSGLPHVQTS